MSARRGVWAMVLFLTVIGTAVLFAAMNLRQPAAAASAGTVLLFEVPTELEEATPPFRLALRGMSRHQLTLFDIVTGLRRAAKDDHVDGMVLHIDEMDWGWAKVSEVRDAILEFRAAGKSVYASLVGGGEMEYFLASAADGIAMPPTSTLQLDGLTLSALFMRGTFDKLDIHPNFAHVGQYKSAVEGYTRGDMSPATREALSSLLDDLYGLVADTLASSRSTTADNMRSIIEDGPYDAPAAFEMGLIDTLLHDMDVDSLLLKSDEGDGEGMPFTRYVDRLPSARTGSHVALVTAAGTIVSGKSHVGSGQEIMLGSETIIDALDEARTRKSIKAVVLRIDSPGGDYRASDDIWRAVSRCQETKPVVVSMSDLAASGGYYIAAPADRIVAQPATWTGSIGIYGGKLNILGLYRKLGLNVETVSRGAHAEMMSPYKDFSPEEAKRFEQHMESAYRVFLSRVSEGRGMPAAEVDSVAQGRVWSGNAALELGLADTLGGIDVAIDLAASLAELDRGKVVVERLPRIEYTFLERLLSDLLEDEFSDGWDYSKAFERLPSPVRALIAAAGFPAGAALALMPYSLEIR